MNEKLKHRIIVREHHRKVRRDILELLGNKCNNPDCSVKGGCTDIRCLQVDHIKSGGSKQYRVKNNISVYLLYLKNPWLAKQELQILCANCNWIKRHENKEHTREIND